MACMYGMGEYIPIQRSPTDGIGLVKRMDGWLAGGLVLDMPSGLPLTATQQMNEFNESFIRSRGGHWWTTSINLLSIPEFSSDIYLLSQYFFLRTIANTFEQNTQKIAMRSKTGNPINCEDTCTPLFFFRNVVAARILLFIYSKQIYPDLFYFICSANLRLQLQILQNHTIARPYRLWTWSYSRETVA